MKDDKNPPNVNKKRDTLRKNRRIYVRDVAEILRKDRESVGIILTEEFNMRNMSVKVTPKVTSGEQKERR